MSDNQDVVLIFPPQWTPIQPYLSIPSLTAYLRANQITVSQYDLNLDFYDDLLSPKHLSPICRNLERIYQKLSGKKTLCPEEQRYFYSIFLVRNAFDEVLFSIEETKEIFRSEERFFDLNELSIQNAILNIAFNIINISCRVELNFGDLNFPVDAESYDEIANFIFQEKDNFLINFLRKQIEDLISLKKCILIGISINNTSQLVPALVMSNWIKVHRPDIHVTFGGNLFSRCSEGLRKLPDFFRYFADSVILLEGEKPLLELYYAIKYKKELATVSNLIYLNRVVIQTKIRPPEQIDALPTPDFDGLKLDKYFSPYLILPILSSRGCYWGKCAFCDHSFIYNEGFRQRNAERVVEDLRILKEKHDTKYFSFSDEALSPSAARKISKKLIENKLDLFLLAQARMESEFSDEICLLMSRAGMKMLFIGLESACDRTLKKINKGINIKQGAEILQRFYNAGILVHLFVITGFPGETLEEAKKTIAFIIENKDNIFSIGASIFEIGKYSPIGLNPSIYGVTLHPQMKPFTFVLDFTYLSGQSKDSVMDLQKNIMHIAHNQLKFGNIWSKLFREQFFLYALKYSENELLEVALRMHDFEMTLYHSIDESEVISVEFYPRLKQGVYLNKLNFDILKIQKKLKECSKDQVEQESSYFLYNLYTQNSMRVNQEGYAILLFCNGNYSIEQIANELFYLYEGDKILIIENVISFFDMLRKGSYIKFSAIPDWSQDALK